MSLSEDDKYRRWELNQRDTDRCLRLGFEAKVCPICFKESVTVRFHRLAKGDCCTLCGYNLLAEKEPKMYERLIGPLKEKN